jgi:hypothetical protein
MTVHFPHMVPGSQTASPLRKISAPYDGTLLANELKEEKALVAELLGKAPVS